MEERIQRNDKYIKEGPIIQAIGFVGALFGILVVSTTPTMPISHQIGFAVLGGVLIITSLLLGFVVEIKMVEYRNRTMLLRLHIKTFFDKNYKPEDYL